MDGTRMSDHKQNNADDSEFDRELAVTSRAYKGAEADLPPPAMDDAIRAAARHAVKSRPRAMGKSWIARYSAPLTAAALVMLTVSVGFIALDERPELAPASLSESVKSKVASSASPTMPMEPPESPSPAVAQAPRLSQPAPAAEKKRPVASPNIVLRGPLAEAPEPALERPRNEDRVAASGAIRPTESNAAVANDRPLLAASPLPAAAPPAAVKEANEPPDAWMKRILELKQQGKMREVEEELAKFRKRYPEFMLPEELKVRQ